MKSQAAFFRISFVGFVIFANVLALASDPSRSPVLQAASEIDRLMDASHRERDVQPNPKTTDEVFLRRVSLDVIGRIPALPETLEFLNSDAPDKRSRLIRRLLDSEGFVSHYFNYWADLLRVQSRSQNGPAEPYIDWIKESLRSNKPYDQFVYELISAKGYPWENGAAGYYLRDSGMPLDHMANTFQVFLGTQLVCAQCHDHPYDSWTQRQYYQQAAFTAGVLTRDRGNNQLRRLRQMQNKDEITLQEFRLARNYLRPLNFRVHETSRKLKLPKDYAYEDARPGDAVEPAAIFGHPAEVGDEESLQETYARWMTSTSNPRFTRVIANRLWKKVMGVGLIEPVDDLKDGAEASHPELLNYLTDLMTELDYDIRQYLEILLNTGTYQRGAEREERDPDAPYSFKGPLLQRMGAEQIWDSFMTLIVPDLDHRPGSFQDNRYRYSADIAEMSLPEILQLAKEEDANNRRLRQLRNQVNALRKKLNQANKNDRADLAGALREKIQKHNNEIRELRPDTRDGGKGPDKRRGFSNQFVRASETVSPAPPGHFLRQFGQSDRETIDNANRDATVPQILTLLNGPLYAQLAGRNSNLYQWIRDASGPEERLNALFLSILTRRPTPEERNALLPSLKEDPKQAAEDLTWALLNTRQFIFIQ